MNNQKTAAVVVDSWKVPVFERHLDKAGFYYTKHPCEVHEATLLRVTTTDLAQLAKVVAEANQEARRGYVEPTYH